MHSFNELSRKVISVQIEGKEVDWALFCSQHPRGIARLCRRLPAHGDTALGTASPVKYGCTRQLHSYASRGDSGLRCRHLTISLWFLERLGTEEFNIGIHMLSMKNKDKSYYIPQQSGTFVTVDESMWTCHHHPKSRVYLGALSWGRALHGFGQICDDTYPLGTSSGMASLPLARPQLMFLHGPFSPSGCHNWFAKEHIKLRN